MGVEVKQGIAVSAYEETDSGASVIIDGVPHTADVVIAADGVKSKAREIVLGYVDKPKSSGYAIYRAFFDGDRIRANPTCAHLVAHNMDQRNCWIGPDVHFIAAGVKGTKEFSWVLTHLDQADVEESWVARGKVEDAIKVVENWDPVVKAVISCTPAENLLDWKLVRLHDPDLPRVDPVLTSPPCTRCRSSATLFRLGSRPRVASASSVTPRVSFACCTRRAVRLADELAMLRRPSPSHKHPVRPSSVRSDQRNPADGVFHPRRGASQGVEDATTIATLLRLAGKHDVPTATRAYQEIRYDRTIMTQQLGVQCVSSLVSILPRFSG